MTTELTIKASKRTESGKAAAKKMRRDGILPAVLYGGGKGSIPIAIDHDDLQAFIRHGQRNAIVHLKVKGLKGSQPVIVQEFQFDPVTHYLLHADLVRIVYGQVMHVTVPIDIQGTSPGVKAGGFMDVVTREISMECLPSKILPSIPVDVSSLEINDHIAVGTLDLGEDYKILDDPHAIIVRISPPKIAEVEEEVEEVEEAAEPEVITRGKEEEEEEE